MYGPNADHNANPERNSADLVVPFAVTSLFLPGTIV